MNAGSTEARLRDATRQILSQEGECAVTMRAVAEVAGVSPGAVYRHYSSRTVLIDAVVAQAVERLQQGVWRALARFPVGSYDRILELGRIYIDFAQSSAADYLILFARDGGAKRRLSDAPFRPSIDVLEQCVRDCIAVGTILPGDPKLITFFLWSRLHGLISLFLTFDLRDEFPEAGSAPGLEALFRDTAAYVLNGLAPRETALQEL